MICSTGFVEIVLRERHLAAYAPKTFSGGCEFYGGLCLPINGCLLHVEQQTVLPVLPRDAEQYSHVATQLQRSKVSPLYNPLNQPRATSLEDCLVHDQDLVQDYLDSLKLLQDHCVNGLDIQSRCFWF